MSTDSIEKSAVISAPLARVWRAISDAQEFGTWFRMKLNGDFREGARLRGQCTYPGYEHVAGDLVVERVVPDSYYLSFRWHPHAVDPARDYSEEPMTLVEFQLEEAPAGTQITIRESGFDALPPGRAMEALRMNSGGWEEQLSNVSRYVSGG